MPLIVNARNGRRPFLHDALVLIKNRFVLMGVGFLTGVIVTRCLGTSGRGVMAAVSVYPALFLSLSELGIRQSAAYHLGKGIFANAQVISAITAMVLATGAVGVLIAAALLVGARNSEFTPLIVCLAVAPIPLTILRDYSNGIFLGNRLVGLFSRIGIMVEFQRLLAVLIVVWLLGWGVAGALLATLLSNITVVFYAMKRLSQLAPLQPRFEWLVIRPLLLKGIVYAVVLFVITVNYQISIVVLERVSTVEQIGLYSVGVSVGTLTWALPEAISTALFSHSATAVDALAFSHKVARLFRVTLVLAALVVVTLALTAPLLVPFVYGEQFTPSVRVVQLLLPGVFCFLALKILALDLAGRGRPNVSLWATIPAAVVNGALGFWLAPSHGAQGAAVASSIAYALGGVGTMVLFCKVSGLSLSELWRYRRADFNFVRKFMLLGSIDSAKWGQG